LDFLEVLGLEMLVEQTGVDAVLTLVVVALVQLALMLLQITMLVLVELVSSG
jgi:hypothetical protein